MARTQKVTPQENDFHAKLTNRGIRLIAKTPHAKRILARMQKCAERKDTATLTTSLYHISRHVTRFAPYRGNGGAEEEEQE